MITLTSAQRERIREFLSEKGYPEFVVTGGLERELAEWQKFVSHCEKGYDLVIEDYTNDLDRRSIIQKILDFMREDKELITKVMRFLKPLDDRFKALLIETNKCVWGLANAHRFPKDKFWWYWGIVKNAKGELLEDLESNGYYKMLKF